MDEEAREVIDTLKRIAAGVDRVADALEAQNAHDNAIAAAHLESLRRFTPGVQV